MDSESGFMACIAATYVAVVHASTGGSVRWFIARDRKAKGAELSLGACAWVVCAFAYGAVLFFTLNKFEITLPERSVSYVPDAISR